MASLNMELQPADAEEFLALFGSPMMVCLGERGGDLIFGEHVTLSMKAENKANKHIFFVPNELTGTKRLDANVTRCRAVFIDDDGEVKGGLTDPTKFPIQPNIAVETSPGKFHYHWLTSTENVAEWRGVEQTLITKFNGDPACSNPARIMRVPGYVNVKPECNGWVAKLTVYHTIPYDWDEILEAFPPTEVDTTVKEFTGEYSKFNLMEAGQAIISGENIHESRRGMAMHFANTNVPQEDAEHMIESYLREGMRSNPKQAKRYQDRLDNNKASVVDAYRKVKVETGAAIIDLKPKEDPYTRLPRPPGKLALLADNVMSCSNKPSWEMAMFTAQALVATYGGGLYHIDEKTTTRLWTVLAETGRGKQVTSSYPSEIVRMLLKTQKVNPYLFIGSEAYSPATIHAELMEHRIRLFTTSEAGLSGKSTAGASFDRRKYILDLTSAGTKAMVTAKQNSVRTQEGKKANEFLKPLYGAVGVFLSESVPVQYIEVLKQTDSFRSGAVAREEIAFIDPIIELGNRRRKTGTVDKTIIDMFTLLSSEFEATGKVNGDNPNNPDMFKGIDTKQIDSQLDDLYGECDTLRNTATTEGDFVAQAMHSRLYEKVLVTVLLQAIVDMAYGTSKLTLPVATPEMFAYAVDYQKELTRSLIVQTASGHLADDLQVCIDRLIHACQEFGTGKTTARDEKHGDIRKKTVGKSFFKAVLDRSKNKAVANLVDQQHGNYDRAIQMVIREVEDLNILIHRKTPKLHWEINL